jgi:hypothetical protein
MARGSSQDLEVGGVLVRVLGRAIDARRIRPARSSGTLLCDVEAVALKGEAMILAFVARSLRTPLGRAGLGAIGLLIFAAGYYLWPVLEWLAKAAGWV